ncbi:MAG: GNAT family N-acetyltransferase [Vallitalea sp.]|jgi:ribosomal protein S18 acetylase RimI-like enzyme|nr:GNAT family N-acetyltransferase [Vallitalea sp.]
MIKYVNSVKGINIDNLSGFFVDWPNPPSTRKHLELLKSSAYVWLALDDETNDVVGFITAITDNILSAYIPLLEVLPKYQGKGIGKQLVEMMLRTLSDYYMVDLCCDESLTKFYKKFSMNQSQGMIIRNYTKQNGR